MSQTIRTEAIVLRRTNYGEADRIIQLLTPEHGKLSAIAKSVRREKSKLAGGVEPFARLDMTLHVGKGELAIVTGSRIKQTYRNILEDYDRLQFGYEVIKQVSKAADALDEQAFFTLLDEALENLNNREVPLGIIKAWFWLQLAILLGQGLNLSTDDNGMRLLEDAEYDFDPSIGAFMFREKGRFTSEHIKILRLLSARPPQIVMKVKGVEALIDDCVWAAEHAAAH